MRALILLVSLAAVSTNATASPASSAWIEKGPTFMMSGDKKGCFPKGCHER